MPPIKKHLPIELDIYIDRRIRLVEANLETMKSQDAEKGDLYNMLLQDIARLKTVNGTNYEDFCQQEIDDIKKQIDQMNNPNCPWNSEAQKIAFEESLRILHHFV